MARSNAMKLGEVDDGWVVPANAIDGLHSSDKSLLMAIDRDGVVLAAVRAMASQTIHSPSSRRGAGRRDHLQRRLREPAGLPVRLGSDDQTYRRAEHEARGNRRHHRADGKRIRVDLRQLQRRPNRLGCRPRPTPPPQGALPALISDPGARKGSNLFYTSWYVSSGNPMGTFSILRTDNLSNYGNRSVPELDGIVNKPLGAMDSWSVSLGQ
ncbi:hypothetical protein SLW73_14950 [Glutamicibacter protophormiae]|nr:hypothetical protein [Glutamicibacter protophormiae]WPR64168.1 hypothetical protein SLW72_14960 [Glutamicibacter protophormiae]WPR67662.1 hypothetical protein SLW73_14950 [Glutamicibacter protophormiae]